MSETLKELTEKQKENIKKELSSRRREHWHLLNKSDETSCGQKNLSRINNITNKLYEISLYINAYEHLLNGECPLEKKSAILQEKLNELQKQQAEIQKEIAMVTKIQFNVILILSK